MSSLKLVVDIGADFIPGVGKAIDAGLGTSIYFQPVPLTLVFFFSHSANLSVQMLP
jgi:hypothetical protein